MRGYVVVLLRAACEADYDTARENPLNYSMWALSNYYWVLLASVLLANTLGRA